MHKVTILPRGRALGYTMVLPDEDKYSTTRNEMLDQLAYMLGGRVAEELVFHDPTTGAANDIEKATAVARAMVTQYGMSERIGAIKLGQESGEVFLGRDMGHQRDYSEGVAEIVDQEVRVLIETAHDEAWEILSENRDVLDALVLELLEKETLNKEEVARIFEPLRRRETRSVWLSSAGRPVSDLPPVVTAEGARRACRPWRTGRPTARRERLGERRQRTGADHATSTPTPTRRRPPTRPRAPRLGRTSPVVDRIALPEHRVPPPFDLERAERAVRELLIAVGEDPDRDGLRETPGRVARMYAEVFAGSAAAARRTSSPRPSTSGTTSSSSCATSRSGASASTTWCRSSARPTSATSRASTAASPGCPSSPGWSTCSPGGPQVQERLTTQVAEALVAELEPRGVIVVFECEHLCMAMRGVRKPGADHGHLGGARPAARPGDPRGGHEPDHGRALSPAAPLSSVGSAS